MRGEAADRFVGTEAENARYVGRPGELTYDTTNKAVRAHDGKTPGGAPAAILTQIARTVDVTQARIFTGLSTVLARALSETATTLVAARDVLQSGDRVFLEDAAGVIEWIAVTSGSTAVDGGYAHTITRDLSGAGARSFPAGTGISNTGQAGDLSVDLFGEEGVTGLAGPGLVVYRRESGAYDDLIPLARLGELDGSHGYAAGTFGLALGENQGASLWLTYDAVNGLRLRTVGGVEVQVAADGAVVLGRVAASRMNLRITTTGVIEVRQNTTVYLRANTDGTFDLASVLKLIADAFVRSTNFASGAAGLEVNEDGDVQTNDLDVAGGARLRQDVTVDDLAGGAADELVGRDADGVLVRLSILASDVGAAITDRHTHANQAHLDGLSQMPAQADSTAADVAGLVADFNTLLAALRSSGRMAP